MHSFSRISHTVNNNTAVQLLNTVYSNIGGNTISHVDICIALYSRVFNYIDNFICFWAHVLTNTVNNYASVSAAQLEFSHLNTYWIITTRRNFMRILPFIFPPRPHRNWNWSRIWCYCSHSTERPHGWLTLCTVITFIFIVPAATTSNGIRKIKPHVVIHEIEPSAQ